jgi:hypothetical protein
MTARDWFRHAFAVDPPGPAQPTPEQQLAVDWVCVQIAKRHMTTPGLIFLEMSRPLNWIGAQTMHFFRPGVWALAAEPTYDAYKQFSTFLEQRGSTEYLAERVEFFEQEFTRAERDGASVRELIDTHFEALRALRTARQQHGASGSMRPDETDA